MEIEADLHLHSFRSDGVLAPAEVVARAARAGLKAIALTDHDTVDGVEEAVRAAPPGLEVIPGVELSAIYHGREIHLLAYFLDPADRCLREFLEPFQSERRLRAERIVARLNAAGVAVTMEEVSAIAGPAGTSLGRPHVAEAIVRRGAARDLDDAFLRYLRRGQTAYVPKPCIPAEEALRVVRSHGGAVVVAHPALNLADADTEALAGEGLDGIEVWHPKHDEDQRRRLGDIARRAGVVASGGSDYHGPGRARQELGSAGVTMAIVAELRETARRQAP